MKLSCISSMFAFPIYVVVHMVIKQRKRCFLLEGCISRCKRFLTVLVNTKIKLTITVSSFLSVTNYPATTDLAMHIIGMAT